MTGTKVGKGEGGGGLVSLTSGGGGGVAFVAPDAWAALPGKIRSIKASAKFRDGIYEGKLVPMK